MSSKHEWMTDGMGFDASEKLLAEYEAEGWELVCLSWDSDTSGFMGCWKRPRYVAPNVAEAVGRLHAWIRDYGDQKQPEFIADLKTVLELK
jgi:hypothetical protein